MSSWFPSQSFFWVCSRQNKLWLFTKNSDEMANPQFKLRSKKIGLVNKFTHCSLPGKLVHFSEGSDPLLSVSLCYQFLVMGLWKTPISLMWHLKNPSEGPSSIGLASASLCSMSSRAQTQTNLCLPSSSTEASKQRAICLKKSATKHEENSEHKGWATVSLRTTGWAEYNWSSQREGKERQLTTGDPLSIKTHMHTGKEYGGVGVGSREENMLEHNLENAGNICSRVSGSGAGVKLWAHVWNKLHEATVSPLT